jgi:predicted nucleotidyltransferase
MSQARKNREEKNKNVVNQLQDFANDSVVFFNKCAKPDKNGKLNLEVIIECRVHEDSPSMRHGFPSHRIHRIYH